GRWRVRELEPGATTVTLRIAYQSPGGLTGLVADRLAAGQVRRHVRATLVALRQRCEGAGGSRATGSDGAVSVAVQQLRAAAVFGGAGLLRPRRPDRLVAA